MKNIRILIVEEDRAMNDVFKKILSSKFDLDFAKQGQGGFLKAIKAYKEGCPFSVVFMDVHKVSGWDSFMTISKIWEQIPSTEIVICTTSSEYSINGVIEKLGITGKLFFLKKPFDILEAQQMALSLTTKWNLEQANRKYTDDLEQKVFEKTKQLEFERSKAESSAKFAALGEMAGGVAHEINNPLSIIQTSVCIQKELLLEEPLNLEAVLKITEKIEATTERIAKIVKGLRSFSRNGEKDPFENLSLKKIIQEAIYICNEKFKNNNVKLIFDEEKLSSLLMIECRGVQMIQVLLNLLNNAYYAIQDLPDKWIKIEVLEKESSVVVSLTDSGAGIPQDVQSKIFQPFFTTKEIGLGTGLGLSISKNLIEEHMGTLKFDNECQNTRFIITLEKNTRLLS